MHLGIPISHGLARAMGARALKCANSPLSHTTCAIIIADANYQKTVVHHGSALPAGPALTMEEFSRFLELWQMPQYQSEVKQAAGATAALAAYPYPEAEDPNAAVSQTASEHTAAVADSVRTRLRQHLQGQGPAPVCLFRA
jgi:hypothetical protein